MFLKTLTLKGFKSFAEATTIELEPGVTVVVGPNGSGKSNVVDAVAWVLGAQGPKVVRSQKMEDVIFAGTGKRAALGRAEVSLTIDNSSKILPVDLSEVTITRTLFRSGDSEYALNGVECRLLDIQELLSDSGVGRTQHVIVSQGQLDWVLNARPEERRMIIEEAAGVLKYRKRREKAERRLEATHGDLQRLTDLLSEVKRSIRPLERQADAARRHGALAEELAGLRLYLAGRDLAALAKAGEQATLQRTELGESDERLVSQLRIFDEQVSGLESRLDVLRQEDLTAVVGQVSAIRERAMGLARVIEERKRSNQMEQQATIARSETARRLEREATELQGEVESSRSDSVISSNAKQTALELVEKAEQAMTAAESEFRIAEADHQRWAARSEALAQAMSQARARAGAERLSGIGGVLGALAEVVDVDEGWELAFEAAVGEVAAAVVVDGAITARESLERFASSEEGGAVLPADIGGNVRSVNVDLSDLPSGCEAIRVHVRASNTLSSRAQMDRVLDGLLASAVVVAGDWTDAMDLASKRGDLVVVTREGDRFAESGWRVGTGGTGASRAALDLARLNESKAASEANRAQNTLSGIRSEYSRARQEYEIKAHEQARNDERLRLLTERLHSLESGLAPIEEPIIEDQKTESQVVGMSADVEAMNRLKAVVAECVSLTEAKLADLASQRDSQTRQLNEAVSKLESARKSRVEAERSLSQVRERQQRIEIELAENRMRTEAAVENLRRDLDSEPEQARIAECPELPPGVTARQREREVERELKLLGPINPLALEELTSLQERHEFLSGQMEDVRNARRDLIKVLRAIDAEIQQVFATAFEDVSENFSALFTTLFPGGVGRLTLTDPANMLETGIEIEARPPGKNVKKLSLLSGGERSLVALAYLFAVFRSRPSPFYILDEVEAALDDVNLSRFLDLLEEFRREAQLIVVSHQKRTMEQADCLYGISMAPGGSSKVLSEKLRKSA